MKEGRTQKIFLLFGFFVFLLFGARAADAATLYFSPSSGNFTVGNVFTVNVLVNTENADINNAETTVNFPSGLLEIKKPVQHPWFSLPRQSAQMTATELMFLGLASKPSLI